MAGGEVRLGSLICGLLLILAGCAAPARVEMEYVARQAAEKAISYDCDESLQVYRLFIGAQQVGTLLRSPLGCYMYSTASVEMWVTECDDVNALWDRLKERQSEVPETKI